MKKMNVVTLILSAVGMLIIIFDGKTVISGMQEGIALCLHTLIPSLFPFFVLSSLVTGTLMGIPMEPARHICKFCRMPAGSESLLVVGILGGYPLGAGNIAAEFKRGNLSKADAERMAIFCNNAGPSFIFGILGSIFSNIGLLWILWAIQITSSILTGFLLPGGCEETIATRQQNRISFSDALYRGIRSMALVCGWVMLFRVILEFLNTYVMGSIPPFTQILFTGLLELSNGCLNLPIIENEFFRFLCAGAMLSLGGICVWMQTQAVFPELNLSRYILGRFLHCLICLSISLLIAPALYGNKSGYVLPDFIIVGCGTVSLLLFLRKPKKEVAFYNSMLYNSR